ncbi:MAG TPA: hypothetical protein VLE97_11535 [Gaiellaceae bacterium]|nr:hypothetical protein [Gaiellaceae bacterium]
MPRMKKSPEQLDREIAAALAATSGAPFGDRRRLRAVSRSVQHEKRKEIEALFPIGAIVKVTGGSHEFVGKIGRVTGYDLGMDEDAALVKVRYGTVAKVGPQRVREGKYEEDQIVRVPRAEGRVTHAARKSGWAVVVEDGYVKVKRDSETIAAGLDAGGKRLSGIEFTRDEYRRSNPTRQKAMKILQQAGYR